MNRIYPEKIIFNYIEKFFNYEKKYYSISATDYKEYLEIKQEDIDAAIKWFENSVVGARFMDREGFEYCSTEKDRKNGTLRFDYFGYEYKIYLTGVIRKICSCSPTRLKNASMPSIILSNKDNIITNYKNACMELISKKLW